VGLPPTPGDGPDFAVEPTKISGYLLNVGHPEGGAKARFFAARGFSVSGEAASAASLRQHAAAIHLIRETANEHGIKRVYEGPLSCPDGTAPRLRSVWHRAPGRSVFLLVRAYPIRGLGRGAAS
jgi:hypothetical protein